MTQTRPLVVSILAVVFGVVGLLGIIAAIAILSGAIEPGKFRIFGQPQPLSKTMAGLIGLVFSGLLFASAYGLWKRKRWGLYLAAIIVLLDLVSGITGGGSLVEWSFSPDGQRVVRVDFRILLGLILLLSLLSSPIREAFKGGGSV